MGASATATAATTEKVVTLEMETAAVVDAPEVTDATPSTAEEQTSSPVGMLGVVGAAVRPQSPPVVPQATAEEDEVVEIERAALEPQFVRILQKCGEEVVVIEEENTTREIKRLKSAIAGVMTQIKGIARTADQRHQLIKRMEPLAEENKILREALSLADKSIQRAQRERDLAESNSRDLEHQNGLSKKNGELDSKTEQLDQKCQQLEDVSKLKSEQDAELNQLRQTVEQIRQEKTKESERADKLAEEWKGGGFTDGLSDAQTQQLEDDVEDVAKVLVGDIDLFGETETIGEA
ncbi:uncharacterized protein [Miscanthus floridulus]|uniref:uncharacterized protein n=1 Tax=Miscanthus floridulus TaxID=154761 RepID=UPI0034574187